MSEQSKKDKSMCNGRLLTIVWAAILGAIVVVSFCFRIPFFWASMIFAFAFIPGFVSAIFLYSKKDI